MEYSLSQSIRRGSYLQCAACVFVNRSVKLKDIPDMIIEAASTSGLVLILAGAGTAMAWGIANERVMAMLSAPLSSMPTWLFLLFGEYPDDHLWYVYG